MSRYYSRDGRPVADVLSWFRMFEAADRQVGDTTIGDVRVSTVFLGLDHQTMPGGPPLIFETMVFGGPLDQEQWRYSTEAHAVAGHDQAVAAVRAALAARDGEG